MSAEPQPVHVLEYQPEPLPTWRPVVRICALASIGIGMVYILAMAGTVVVRLLSSPSANIRSSYYEAVLIAGGVIGVGMLIGGAGSYRLNELYRRILVFCCAALAICGLAGMGLEMLASLSFVNRTSLRQEFGGSFGIVGLMLAHLPVLGSWFFAPAMLFVLLRRPEARRVFQKTS